MAAEQSNEQEIQFKKRARRRLVGAIALVLLMVAVLPMLLDDHSTKAPQQEIAINIPSQDDSDFASRVVPTAPESATVSDPEAAAPVEASPQPAEPAPVAERESAAESQPVPSPAAEDKPAAKPESKPTQPAAAGDAHAVQIGVYSTMASIKELQQKLLAHGYKSYTERIATEQGEKIRLRAGPFSSRAEAEKALAKIKSAGMPGIVVAK